MAMDGLRVSGKLKRGPVVGPLAKSRRLVNNAVKNLRRRTPEVGRFRRGVPSKNTQQRESDNSSLDRNGRKLVSTAQHSKLEDQCDDDDGIYTINLPYCDVIPMTSGGSNWSMEVGSDGKSLSRRKYSDLLGFKSDKEADDKSAGIVDKSTTSYPNKAFGGSNGKPVSRRNYSDLLKKSKSKGEEPDLVYLD